MDTFDYMIMAVGIVLVVVGLILFISGKKEGGSNNNVEGFGIKLNVSNPSILLIVFGVALLLVPKLLPNDRPGVDYEPPLFVNDGTNTEGFPEDMPVKPELQKHDNRTSQLPENVYLPSGTWYLTDYSMAGQDMSNLITGNINFKSQSMISSGWLSNLNMVDYWGNYLGNYQYQGVISSEGNLYYIAFYSSNAPDFVRKDAIPLELKTENAGILHMRYMFQGAEILLHWQQ